MTLNEIITALLTVAAIISLLTLIAGWLRPRGDEERQLGRTESAIRQKHCELPGRQRAGGDQRVQQVSNDIEQARRKAFGERRK